jgi:GR25 family glycosyltransferase involved in LPS biosynthesis
MINNYFDEVFCINLDKRTDRWEKSQEEFKKAEIEAIRYSAFDGSKIEKFNLLSVGEVGALRSHLGIFKLAFERKLKNVLIFEDDIELSPDFLEQFIANYFKVPDNWDMLYFGGNHVGGITPVNESVAKIYHSYAIHAYAVKCNMFSKIIERLEKEELQVDVYLAELQKECNAYVFRPHIAFQRADFSDIQGGPVDYDFLRR